MPIIPGRVYYIPLVLKDWNSIVSNTPGWEADLSRMDSVGFMPVYETREQAEKAHPGVKIMTAGAAK